VLPLRLRFNFSTYDAAYIILTERLGEPFVTGDEELYRAVHEQMERVVWFENYKMHLSNDRPAG
jgi:predicted nucleic acid-binding protein